MTAAYICDCLRTPIGRYGGALAAVRPDDLAALVLRELLRRQPSLAATEIEDVILGCANQAGEDNRNVARMAALLAGLPAVVPGVTVNRLCGSGLEAVAAAARMIQSGEGDVVVAGGVESMSRAPFVVAKSSSAYARDARMFDTTIGWRFVNPLLAQRYGVDSMPETAENVAAEFGVSRADQDHFALRSQQRAAAAQAAGLFTDETISVPLSGKTGLTTAFSVDESPRATSLAALAGLPALIREGGSVTAGNSCGLNDGAAALLLASPAALDRHGLKARAKVIGTAVVGVEPRTMGLGPAPATRKLLQRLGLRLADLDVIEVNEAFAAQALAVLRELEVADDARQVNALGGAIALGHPLGASGARLVTTAVNQLERKDGKFALCTMCIGVGQGIAMVLERVAGTPQPGNGLSPMSPKSGLVPQALFFVLGAAAMQSGAPSAWAADDAPAAESAQAAAKAPGKPDLSGRQRIGKASVYAKRLDGRKMADGTPMQMDSDSAASKTLPLGTKAKVTSLETGRSAVVTIRDRGPYVHGRILDVSPSTARKIGLGSKRGVAKVAVEPITVPLPDGGVKRGDGDT